jgi:predicted enzyme related to lactoylglutathione lyase
MDRVRQPHRKETPMIDKVKKLGVMVALLAAVAVGSAVIANAASDKGTTGSSGATSSGATGRQGAPPPPPPRPNQKQLTGDTADKVTKAAEDKVPGGTVLRAESNGDGSGYHAHVRKSDGSEVVVEVNEDFEATAVRTHPPFPGRGAPGGGPPGGPGAGEKPLTGDTADKVKKAAEDKVDGGTVLRVETDAEGSPYEAHVRKSDGSEVVVKVNKDFDVTDVEEHPGPPGPPPGGAAPGTPAPGTP